MKKANVSRFLVAVLAAATLMVGTQSAEAAVLVPGGNVIPDVIAFSGAETILASVNRPLAAVDYTGSLVAAVINEGAANPLGGLTFIYQVTNDATSDASISRVTHSFFSSFMTNVHDASNGSALAGFINGTQGSLFADRSANGNTVGFNFAITGGPDFTKINPGETSLVMVIRTNAPLFDPGISSVINGDVDNVATFQPAANVAPEPASLLMLGGGLIGFGAMLRRRRSRSAA